LSGSSGRAAGYGRAARILSVGIAATGLFTFAYFALASHVLDPVEAKRLDVLWSVMFVVISVIYRPIEQLLSRTLARDRALGARRHPVRTPLLLQAGFALAFLVVALALRDPLQDDLFDGSAAMYWVLVAGTLLYAGSYFARGWLAGHQHFGLYGGLVLMESVSRFLFPLAVAVGIASGETAVALGIAAAPLVSLVVVPIGFARRDAPADAEAEALAEGITVREGTGFALAVAGIMLAEQALLNAAVLTTELTASDAALAGIVFNVFLITRAPLQLFQAVQTSLLPHLAGLEATAGHDAFRRAVRVTVTATLGFGVAVALGLLAIGPWVMETVFGQDFSYGRAGLALVGLGMGLHLMAGTFNQAALARGHAARAAAAWLAVATGFVAWTLLPVVDDQLLRAEVGYLGATAVLSALLWRAHSAAHS
jgi:O-antigen/teichoic acid export membrane protein